MESSSELDAAHALAIVQAVAGATPAPVSIVVSDDHGEPIASLRMDGAALDTYENARRKAYTAARSDQPMTSALADKVRSSPSELASFDPSFSFFMGGVAVLSGGRRVGAVGVSGLPGPDDEAVAIAAISAVGLDAPT
jgi:glc operon protein GlcG